MESMHRCILNKTYMPRYVVARTNRKSLNREVIGWMYKEKFFETSAAVTPWSGRIIRAIFVNNCMIINRYRCLRAVCMGFPRISMFTDSIGALVGYSFNVRTFFGGENDSEHITRCCNPFYNNLSECGWLEVLFHSKV